MDKKKIIVLLVAVFITAAAASSFITYKLTKNNEVNDIYIPESEYDRFLSYFEMEDIRSLIGEYSLTEADRETLINGAKNGMVSALGDGYSRYYPEELFRLLDDGADGSNIVMGAALKKDPKTGCCVITKVYPDSPASEAGLSEGELISRIGDYPTAYMELDEAILRLRGQDGTEISISVLREEGETPVTLARKTSSYEVVFTDVPAEGIGFVEIFEFSQNSADQLDKAISQLKKEGITKLIIDLRGTNGGFASQAIESADFFLTGGTIARSQGKEENTWTADKEQSFEGEIILLIDGETAGAAEIFIAALGNRAETIGEKTAGKVPVFSYVQLPNSGNGLKIVSGYYTMPDGSAIEGKGIAPDYLRTGGSGGSLETDAQLQAALELLGTEA